VPTRYSIRHITRFNYDVPVSESLMEVRMQPRTEGTQRCLRFELAVTPRARVFGYRDHLGNSVHHFDTPARHTQLTITARAYVELDRPPAVPAAIDARTWREVDTWADRGELWDFLQPSRFAVWSPALREYVASISGAGGPVPSLSNERVSSRSMGTTDPLTTIRALMQRIHRDFEYVPRSTRVDSPIDEALAAGRGVCQDLAHIMIAASRLLGLPCRYVSGYIAPKPDDEISRLEASATHAWVEVRLPTLGWVGLDPTHNAEAGRRHVRVAVGRDYADLPPTRGVFKGGAASTLTVTVDVSPSDAPTALEPMLPEPQWATEQAAVPDADFERQAQMQQQQ
jgi:transglutaminase-like putative cysteine protease